ncbi:adenylate cyclase [Terrimonas sp.]|uniref:CYTH domain-containing protein n=1 Tax=Terrimonas sp. TaxID=1914338 RepID=UPI000D517382|nr:CYTH domain-containing protein [Terrimonas sp.]PVD53179.1 adenylate cyclase [Terrimonas sp.]
MPLEIERKFLINHNKWNTLPKPQGKLYRQGYLLNDIHKTIRVRLSNENAFITIKGKTTGATRSEFEYNIPLTDAKQLLDNFSNNEISKTRYNISYRSKLWEIDVFHGENEGLIVAEIELQSEGEPFDIPDWVTEEVTHDPRYYNANLAVLPFKRW